MSTNGLCYRGCDAVDAPVSGGDKGAKAGTLAIMAGGQQETVSDINGWSSHIQTYAPLSFRKALICLMLY